MFLRSPFRLPGSFSAAPLRGAAAVMALAVAVVTLVLTGGTRPGPRPATYTAADGDAASAGTMNAAMPDVSRALGLFGLRSAGVAAPAARSSRSHRRGPLHRWVRPNDGPFSSPFGMRWGRLHAGIDLAGAYGSTIVAATDGCIAYAGPMSGYGEVMQISDWDGTETVYGHMSSFLRTSGCVHAGEPIARVGSGGDATGPHLHFEVRVGGVPVDPVPFLARRGVFI